MSHPSPSDDPRRGRARRRFAGAARVLGLVALGAGLTRAADPSPSPIEFNRDIRPILSENCFACHGPDSAARKADLRLDKREIALEMGSIAPGDPDSSELVARIESVDADEQMPPKSSHKTLTAGQKDLLKRWIAAGAEYQPHWSLIAPKRPAVPAVKDAAWPRNAVDRFILAKLEQHGLHPAPEADRRTLARRLSLDLTGLPPTPAEVDAFVNDPAPDYYEKYVDTLMSSPRWGEHRGRYWLDAARYADSHGIHMDNFREIWAYRAAVIDAFNRNQPFDQFTVEQLAGDLLPGRSLDQQVASGFNRCNITTSEGGAIDEEYAVLYARDRTETTSQVWLGLTTGCAVCHDHKFDPISQREFYELSAFFNNTTQKPMDGNAKDTPPILFVPDTPDRARWHGLEIELAGARQQAESRKQEARVEFTKWLAETTPETFAAMIPAEGLRLRARLDSRDAEPAGATLESADSGDFEKDQPYSVGAWVKLGSDKDGALVARMDDQHDYRGWDVIIQGGKVSSHLISKWPMDALKVTSDAQPKPGEWAHVLVTYDGSAKAAGLKVYLNGQSATTKADPDALKGSTRASVPLKVGQRHSSEPLTGAGIHDLRVYGRALSAAEAEQLSTGSRAAYVAAKPAEKRTEAEVNEVFDWYLATRDQPTQQIRAKVATLEKEQAEIKARGTIAHVMQERDQAAMAYILNRGEYDKRKDPVKPSTPAALPPMPDDLPRNRLGLARWLLRPEHPLTARVTVNRFWQELFGAGIVRTAGDFGVTGEAPSDPELLDWLAVEFREGGWDVKQFFKLLVTSAAYRQSAAATPEALEKDPGNRLVSHGPRFRMDAEMVRDYALAAGGLLVEKLGGPSVKPYMPDGVWEAVAMPESNTRYYKPDTGDKLYRRSLYTFWKRSAPPASMDIFNAPSRETCTVRRERTNTPLQALVTLNDPQFIEAARHLAQIVMKDGGAAAEGRLDLLAKRLIARPLKPEEARVALAEFAELQSYYQSHPEDAAKLTTVGESKPDPALDAPALAAWTMLANSLMNLDEALNK